MTPDEKDDSCGHDDHYDNEYHIFHNQLSIVLPFVQQGFDFGEERFQLGTELTDVRLRPAGRTAKKPPCAAVPSKHDHVGYPCVQDGYALVRKQPGERIQTVLGGGVPLASGDPVPEHDPRLPGWGTTVRQLQSR